MHAGGAGLGKVQVRLKWDPSAYGEPARHLDIVAATYAVGDPYGRPEYVVHTESRSPDGTITMTRHSETGLGLGYVEIMELEFARMPSAYGLVVVGVAIHQNSGLRTFGDLSHTGVLVVEGYRSLMTDDFAGVADATAATIAEFVRDGSGAWHLRELIRGFDSAPTAFMAEMGRERG
ncbi:TerD family protein [Streptomyces sp. NBC_00285]|uniref:TerD family protein n=1 Tax=Streptomyces sp. NBC_00285 TaxID=2975700 RepID=UPI002E2DACE7|nr:TerD family protein [Streptomyces sp. NBC_00285]